MIGEFIAKVHTDYLAFIKIASSQDIGDFIKAQIAQAEGNELPALSDVSKALLEAHNSLIERLKKSSEMKSIAGSKGMSSRYNKKSECYNGVITETNNVITEVKQCNNDDIAMLQPNSLSLSLSFTDSNTVKNKEKTNIMPEKSGESKKSDTIPEWFNRIWGLYPFRISDSGIKSKGAKDAAYKHCQRILTDKAMTVEDLVYAVVKYSEERCGGDKFTMDASKFFGRDGHWKGYLKHADTGGFDVYAHCTDENGEIDYQEAYRIQAAIEGREGYGHYLPEAFKRSG